MAVLRRLQRALLALGAVAASSCGIVEPCELGVDTGIQGTWTLTKIDGQPIPANGAFIPGRSERLKAGALVFARGFAGGCGTGNPVRGGGATALFDLVTQLGTPTKTTKYGGGYTYFYSTGIVRLKAGGRQIDGNHVVHEITIVPNFPVVGSAVLTFEQTSSQ
jgi:hypothetical protein